MVFFKNSTVYTTLKTKGKNKIGQLVEGYKSDKAIQCNIHPVDEKSIKYVFGEDIKSSLQMFSDENILVNNILVYDNKTYKIEKKINWIDYKIYALLEVDVEVLNEKSK